MKTISVLMAIVIVSVVVYLYWWAPGRHDDRYCGLCGQVRNDYFAFGCIFIKAHEGNANIVKSWHSKNMDHIWLLGSSHPYNGGKYPNVDSQYAYMFAHQMIDSLPEELHEKYKNKIIDLMKKDDGKNSTLPELNLLLKTVP